MSSHDEQVASVQEGGEQFRKRLPYIPYSIRRYKPEMNKVARVDRNGGFRTPTVRWLPLEQQLHSIRKRVGLRIEEHANYFYYARANVYEGGSHLPGRQLID